MNRRQRRQVAAGVRPDFVPPTALPFFEPTLPFICFADGGSGEPGSGEPGAGGAGDKTFSQADVDRIVANSRRETEAKFADYEDIKAKAGQVDELSSTVNDLKVQIEDANKSEAEKLQAAAERAREQAEEKLSGLEKQILEITAERDGAIQGLNDFRLQTHVGGALSSAGVLPKASKHALGAFLAEAQIKVDEKGQITSVSLADVPQKNLPEACAQYLKDNPHFKAATTGGGGTTPPNGGQVTQDQMADMSAEELAGRGWSQQPVGGQARDPFPASD